jgi:DNA-binding response OmpR family regulator
MSLPDVKSILLIEDDENDAFLMETAFRKVGGQNTLRIVRDVDTATAHLLDVPRGALPAIILLDLTLPGKSGFQFLQWIRDQPAFRHVAVLVFTSNRYRENIRRAFELGAASYMVKPRTLDELRAFAKSVVDYWLKVAALTAGPA